MNLSEKIGLSQNKRKSLLCLGLDPDTGRHGQQNSLKEIEYFLLESIRNTRDSVAGYKVNLAFFLALGVQGLETLRKIREAIPDDSIMILDAKWGDIGNTARKYAQYAYEILGADMVTAHPYMGRDGVEPFIADHSRGIFLLCRTSNPNGAEMQLFPSEKSPLFLHVARLASKWNEGKNIGLVVGATFPSEMREIREAHPDLWFLVPGIGAQGGKIEDVLEAANNSNLLIAASRSLLYPSETPDPEKTAVAVSEMNQKITRSGE